MRFLAAVMTAALTLLGTGTAQATDILGARASGGLALGPDTLGWAATIGGTYDLFLDNYGGRLGLDVGYLQYEKGGRKQQWLGGAELAAFLGADDATWRPYVVVEPLFSASAQVVEGLRFGPELEWRDVCESHLRVAAAALYQPMRNTGGVDWAMFGARVSLTWGPPTRGCVRPRNDKLPGQP